MLLWFVLFLCITFTHAGIDEDSVKGISRNNFDYIRIKVHYVQDEAELIKLSGDARILRIVKDAMDKAVKIIHSAVKVERLTKPLLISRPCKTLDERRYLNDDAGRPRKWCQTGCYENVTCLGGDIQMPNSHLDDCYIHNRGPVGMKHGNGLKDTDLVVYIKVYAEHIKYQLAAASPCNLEPTAKDRPTSGIILLAMDVFGHYIRIKQPHGYHSYISALVHELIHILGFIDFAVPFFRIPESSNSNSGKPLTQRSSSYPYLPKLGTVNDLRNASMFDGLNYFYKPNPSIMKINKDGSSDWKGIESVKAAVAYYNCEDLNSVHFGKTGHNIDTLIGDTMGPLLDEVIRPPGKISSLTAAFLEDTGWYKIDRTKVARWQGGTGFLGCEFAKNGCKKYEKWPCCSEKSPSEIRCGSGSISKGICVNLKPLSDQYVFRVMYVNPKMKDELWKYTAPFCRYSSWTPKQENNILWEMLDKNSGFCFQYGKEKTKMDRSKLPSTLKSGWQQKYFNGNQRLSGCYKVDCNVPNGYNVSAAFGSEKFCNKDGTNEITFEHNRKKIGPFKCWKKDEICKERFEFLKYTVPS